MIGQCCNFQGINSTVEISWDIFRILADYRLRHLVNNVAIHIYTYDYIRMEITVLYLTIWRYRIASNLNLRPSNLQLMPWNCQIQYSYLLSTNNTPNYRLCQIIITNTVKPVLRGHPWEKEKVALYNRWPIKRGSIHMKFSMTGQKKSDLLIQVTTWAGFTVYWNVVTPGKLCQNTAIYVQYFGLLL